MIVYHSAPAYARHLRALERSVTADSPKALRARTELTGRTITATAVARSRRAAKYGVSGRWVRTTMRGSLGEVRLRGGFAFLTELGSHRHPEGWDERPKKVTTRRQRAAARRGVTLTQRSAMPIGNVGSGFAAKVRHPKLAPQHFWQAGIETSRRPGHEVYRREVFKSIR